MTAKRATTNRLRSRLYIGMLPVAGLLILVCLYSVYNYTRLGARFDSLQTNHYAKIVDAERLLLATSQLERAVLLQAESQRDLARSAYERSEPVLGEWLAKREAALAELVDEEAELVMLARNLRTLAASAFESEAKPDTEALVPLVEQIETLGMRLVSAHNQEILSSNADFRGLSSQHFYVVLSAIVASLLLMVLVSYTLSGRILAPIDALTDWAGRLGEGNWETEYRPSSKDEIARLEHAFVDMAARIREYKRITGKEIVRTRRRMEQCFSNLPNPVLFLNAKREIAYTNPAAKELVQQPSWKAEMLPQLERRIDTLFGTGEEVVVKDFDETVSARMGSELKHFLPIFVRVDSEEIDDIECGLVLQDVTQLRLSDELKSDLVATVSHEIKTPVTSATMALHLVLEKSLGELNEDQEEMLQTASSDLNRLKRLLNNLLEIARLESKSPRIERVSTNPSQLVSMVTEAYAVSAQSRGIDLAAKVEEGLPALEMDLKAMEVALSNYLSNAIKYGPQGSTVEVYARRVNGCVRFGVRDEGQGLPEEDVEKVFEKFYRSSRHRSMEGIGLGLSIVKDIAMAHGGSAGCELKQPTGCDFYIQIDRPERAPEQREQLA